MLKGIIDFATETVAAAEKLLIATLAHGCSYK